MMKEKRYELEKTVGVNNQHRQTLSYLLENNFLNKSDFYLYGVKLTKREKQCLALYLQGMTVKEIGRKIFRSHRTVETHIKNIKEKLEAYSRSEVFIKAKKMSLLKELDETSISQKLGIRYGYLI